ncbi:helix-turn-helix domain-containing protein [Capnocytophaga endodontalis]|uniref:Helicase n=1 Tax=Capnocytophaga endodontalis TaxID=2708117 RepID=A0A1Z4BNB3_9FLAO|nr:helix-turn-helix domain-containing protein [Capnocytophaga endodontalis]ASF42765.1 helicase [Capnocytophaga endodontalis]
MEERILTLINETNRNIFLTGKAGTGKTTLLHKIIETSYKNTVVVAPTGIAALNARGVTIHSQFQLPFASFLPTSSNPPITNEFFRFENRESLKRHFQMHRNKQQVIKNMELLIVDEVSMLRADVLDAMDFMMQFIRKDRRPFGGVQVLFIGDLLQLPPVVKQEEWEVLKHYYTGMYFFQSQVISQHPLLYIELEKIYRQTDGVFISILNHLRDNKLTQEDLRQLASHVRPEFAKQHKNEYITLTTHNHKADMINQEELEKLTSPLFSYEADVVGDFPEYLYPIEKVIQLKEGARVMFIKNDPSGEHLFFNGKMGTVVALGEKEVSVALDDGITIDVERYEWENVRYKVNDTTKDIEEERLGTFTQYPLRLAWAITIHKSQGLTFEKAVLDLASVFASGQAYVAFSRLRSLDGLVLLSSVTQNGIDNDEKVIDYADNKATEEEMLQACREGRIDFLRECILKTFDWQSLLEEWYTHSHNYIGDLGNKNAYKSWAMQQYARVKAMVAVSEKFSKQLLGYFQSPTPTPTIFERILKAVAYFSPLLETIWYELLYVETKVTSLKKVKEFSKELKELDDSLTEVIKKLFRLEQMVVLLQSQTPFSKENIQPKRLEAMRFKLIERVLTALKNEQLFANPPKVGIPEEKTKKDKKEKISTYDITLQLWQQNKTVAEIAKERMFTEGTIYGHLAKLIERGILSTEIIEAIFTTEEINELEALFESEEDLSTIKGIYEKANEKYDYGRLRLFKEYFLSKR